MTSFYGVFLLVAITPSQISLSPHDFASASVADRRTAMAAVAEQVGPKETLSPETISLIELGLGDSDFEVRRSAFTAVGYLAMRQAVSRRRGGQAIIDAKSTARLEPLVRAGLTDQNEQIRAYAVNGTALVSRDTGTLESVLVERYRVDRSPLVRRQAIARLGELPSLGTPAQATLVKAANDPSDGVKQQAALAIREHKPQGGLVALVTALEGGVNEPGPRGSLVGALTAYGQAARQYVPFLQGLLQRESNLRVRQEIERTLNAIQQ